MKDYQERQLARAVGSAISSRRMELGLTQEDAASALQIGPEAISRMERGVVCPSLARLVDFAELYKCPVETFIGGAAGLVEDTSRSITVLISELDRADRQFVFDLVQRTCAHLKR